MQYFNRCCWLLVGLLAVAVSIESAAGVITVQIGGATRLNSLSRQRDRYNCYWDCDLVGCQIARDDDECAYDCEKICRVRYDYAAGRSGAPTASGPAAKSGQELAPKSGSVAEQPAVESNEINASELLGGEFASG